MEKIRYTDLKCPKCKSNTLYIQELWTDASIEWEVINGVLDRNDGNLEPGSPYRIESTCKNCSHKWKVRNVSQIDHIIKSN